jgi:hypothetical protein
MSKQCVRCKKVKPINHFGKLKTTKDGIGYYCKECQKEKRQTYRNTERGYISGMYNEIVRVDRPKKKCHFTFEEFYDFFKRHKYTYGMKSAWGPGPDQLEKHLPITMIAKGDSNWSIGKGKRTASNLSVDRLDSSKDYTLQNVIFIRNDENRRKNSSSYEDCKIHIKLYEDRFIKMKAI